MYIVGASLVEMRILNYAMPIDNSMRTRESQDSSDTTIIKGYLFRQALYM